MAASFQDGVTIIDGEVEIVNYLRILGKNKEKLWLWQEGDKGTPRIYQALIKRVEPTKKNFDLVPADYHGVFEFEENKPISVYSKERKLHFQVVYRNLDADYLVLEIPKSVSFLSDKLTEKFNFLSA